DDHLANAHFFMPTAQKIIILNRPDTMGAVGYQNGIRPGCFGDFYRLTHNEVSTNFGLGHTDGWFRGQINNEIFTHRHFRYSFDTLAFITVINFKINHIVYIVAPLHEGQQLIPVDFASESDVFSLVVSPSTQKLLYFLFQLR